LRALAALPKHACSAEATRRTRRLASTRSANN
jgi:hypothetical protein